MQSRTHFALMVDDHSSEKKMLGVEARKEYAHTFAHFNHRRCANVQKYMSVDDQSSKKKLLN